ncbi:peptidoglycan bridge formation glycyltransferase FemA/FemB family protein [Candidatus Saccharibacteria bacterium]|nr:peptidoglycan bridge formation glycyltransferase FemA/FemB family protein [Candidatus Saccharibacteria bacterium]
MNKDWNKNLFNHEEANFLQSLEWAKVNEAIGHKVIFEKFDDKSLCLMIVKNAKRGRYMEIPGGPIIDWQNPKKVERSFNKIKEIAKTEHCAFIRLRPQLENTEENREILKTLSAKPATMHLHAEHTVILDLTKNEDELMADMRRQTRYEVRRALKMGIKVEFDNSEEIFKKFHKIQAETAARQHFIPPDLKTLLAEHEAFGKNAKIYTAYIEEDGKKKDIAYGLILVAGEEAEYFEAASTDLNRQLPGAHALQWQVMRDLKAAKIKRYNLWGIAPPNQPNHRYAKVTTFKTGFGGEVKEFIHAHDIIVNKVQYLPNLIVEKIRKKKRHL